MQNTFPRLVDKIVIPGFTDENGYVLSMIDHVEKQLAAGYRASYKEPKNYGDAVILEYPDGHREISGMDDEGNEYHIRDIPGKKRPHHQQ